MNLSDHRDGPVPGRPLTDEGSTAMAWIKLKTVAAMTAAAIFGASSLFAVQHFGIGKSLRNAVAARPATLPSPAKIKPGDRIRIEMLEALPGRPITGERLVRPDGTISLGFYGDLMVAGLDRYEIKVKAIELLAKTMSDGALGLERVNLETGKIEAVPPIESPLVFVDDTPVYETRETAHSPLSRFSQAVESLEQTVGTIGPNGSRPQFRSDPAARPSGRPPASRPEPDEEPDAPPAPPGMTPDERGPEPSLADPPGPPTDTDEPGKGLKSGRDLPSLPPADRSPFLRDDAAPSHELPDAQKVVVQRLDDQERRMGKVETTLEQILKTLEELKRDKGR